MSLYAAVVFSSPTTPLLAPTTPVILGRNALPIADMRQGASHAYCRVGEDPLHATHLACLAVPVDPLAPHQIHTAYLLPAAPAVPALDGADFAQVDDLLALANVLPVLVRSNPNDILPRLAADPELRYLATDALFASACADPHGKRLARRHAPIIRSLVDHQLEPFSLAATAGRVH